MRIVNFRVDENEFVLMRAIAKSKGMTLSGYIRQHFHSIAIQEKLIADPLEVLRQSAQPKDDKPQVTRVPIPTGINAWRDEIYRRSKAGEPVQVIADSYGVHADVIRQKINAAKLEEKIGAAPSTHNQPLPEYNPVDPDNPTLEEQKANAERARIQLENLGFSV